MGNTILLSGATGLVGGSVLRSLEAGGHTVRALTRRPEQLARSATFEPIGWDGIETPATAVARADGVIHLSGEPIFGGPATARRKERIHASRIDATRRLVDVIGATSENERPAVLVCASAVGYYGDRGEERLPESADPGSGFLADLCVQWEREAHRAESFGVRVVSLRFGVVLSSDGGALSALGPLFRLGLGGRVGNGRQWFPWIHLVDAAGLAIRALEDPRWSGPFNAVAPGACRNAEFTRELARVVQRPAWF
ncbi:MAG: TIGR01777 family oxidoreductase, partial [Myxococcales bacterium]|nr:TIGR01777 family oxidoreductase [Myxococcales bacterium]